MDRPGRVAAACIILACPGATAILAGESVPPGTACIGTSATLRPLVVRARESSYRPRNDAALGPPRHHLPLQAGGVVRRASHDVSPARQLRPEAARGPPADHAAALQRPLGARRIRELRDDRRVYRCGGGRAALREQHLARSFPIQHPGLPDRGLCQDVSLLLRTRGDCGSGARDGAPVPPMPMGPSSAGCGASCARGNAPTRACC